ncbi:MAG: acyl-CoA synthetase, ADP-forming, partial [Actinobacteria bacterium]|nr:acyl-CoA synthetase, ADP-forming [Actinomycetota bacterium]
DQFRAAIEVLLAEDGVDSIFINFVTAPFTDTHEVARQIVEASRKGKKPVVCNFMTDLTQERYRITMGILKEGGIPFYATPTAAARALGALARYGRIRRRDIGLPERFADADAVRARSVIDQARKAGRSVLPAADVYAIFEAYGIPVAGWKVVRTAEEAVSAAETIGYPVVVKVDSAEIDHKSDMGGVAVNLRDAAAVRLAVEGMLRRLGSYGELKFLVQKFLPGGRELIVGATGSRGLGHLVMFGLGGIYVEVLKDVVFKIAPVTRVEAREMLDSIKTKALLDGMRGEKGVDREKVVSLIQRVSMLLTDLPEIKEMDLNPIMAFENAVCAVDGRIRI